MIPFWPRFYDDGEELDGPAEFSQLIVGLSYRITINFASSASFSAAKSRFHRFFAVALTLLFFFS